MRLLNKKLIPRPRYMQTLRDLRDQNVIKVLTGVRRCGKSTLLLMFADELRRSGVTEAQIQFYNFEDLETLALGDIFQIHTHIKNKLLPNVVNYIFLDEVQNVPVFQRLVDSLFIKPNVDLYITGSNAHLLSGELATLLTGRYIETEILPLQFHEYHKVMSSKPPNLSKLESLAVYATEGAIPEYLTLREIQQEKADDFVRGVLNTIIEKDILQRLDIRDKHNFNKIIDFVLDSVGSFVSPRSISDTLRTNGFVVDKEAVAKYLDAMCEAFLLHKVPRYEIKGKGLLQTLNKYYLVDPCFRRVRLRRDMKKDIPHWLENVVYFELLRRNRDVYIGKFRDKEIDFVVTDRNGYTSYYQVAWTTMNRPETLERELAPLRSINDSNPKFLLTTDIDVNPVYDGIQKLNVMDWLLSAPDALATAEIPQPTPPAKQTPEQTAGEGLGIKTDGGLGKRLGMKLGIKLGINHEKIIDLIKENPCVTMSEIAEKLKVSDTSIEKSIQRLKALGILTRVGARKNGHWQLAEQTNHS